VQSISAKNNHGRDKHTALYEQERTNSFFPEQILFSRRFATSKLSQKHDTDTNSRENTPLIYLSMVYLTTLRAIQNIQRQKIGY
jgi:hypothetical protein